VGDALVLPVGPAEVARIGLSGRPALADLFLVQSGIRMSTHDYAGRIDVSAETKGAGNNFLNVRSGSKTEVQAETLP
jgi:hypothetical protein